MDIGNRIKQRRIDLDISADELAEMVGKSRATIYRYENGDIENLPTTILEPLAVALSTTPAYLMGWNDDPYDYDNYDLEIPSHFNGDVKKFFEFEEAVKQDALKEHREFDAFLKTITPSEREKIEKYRDLDTHGKEMVDFTLLKEWERSTAEAEKSNVVPMDLKEDTTYYVNAAHADDYVNAPEELKQQEEDIMDDENF